jgi:hypothetical protein
VFCDWFASTHVDWLSAENSGGTLKVIAAPNSSSTPRVGTVTVFQPFWPPQTINVTQAGQ